MSKLKVAVGPLVALSILTCLVAPTLAAFKAEKETESAVKSEGGKTTLTVGTSYKVKCEKLTNEGFVAKSMGKTGKEAKEDEPASEPITESEVLGLKIEFKECKAEIGKTSTAATVNTEKCQFELFQNEESEKAKVSLRGVKKEVQCVIKIEAKESKCTVEIGAVKGKENEFLEGLKLKTTKSFESEIESGSEVKGITVKEASAGCEIKEKEGAGVLKVEAADKIKGSQQDVPIITRMEGDPEYGNVVSGNEKVTQFKFRNRVEVKYEMDFIRGLVGEGGAFKLGKGAGENECDEAVFVALGECKIKIKFLPLKAEPYLGRLEIPFEVRSNGAKRGYFLLLKGTGT